mmetsp:Transcript_43397/g.80318  ORF Transcript_43397/g.80318 Transcript_43397/m.80318 type:complete len:88 (+) Transcript_43397:787-1050(+)
MRCGRRSLERRHQRRRGGGISGELLSEAVDTAALAVAQITSKEAQQARLVSILRTGNNNETYAPLPPKEELGVGRLWSFAARTRWCT